MKKIKNIKTAFLYIVVVCTGIFLLFVVITFTWIGYEVKDACRQSATEHGGNCVESLSSLLNDEKKSYRERNTAIWALGQLADPSALPVLEKYYTGNIPPREPLDKIISQYELKKAIRWCKEGNITSWMYRGLTED